MSRAGAPRVGDAEQPNAADERRVNRPPTSRLRAPVQRFAPALRAHVFQRQRPAALAADLAVRPPPGTLLVSAPPLVAPPPPAHDATGDESYLATAIGRNLSYYLKQWQGRSDIGGFNWAAFFLSGIWITYRKMYRIALLLLGLVVAVSVVEELVFAGWLGLQEAPRAVDRAVALTIAVVCGRFGNRWYHAHVTKLLQRSADRFATEAERLAYLKRSGGTSLLAALGWFLLLLVASIAAYAVLGLLPGSESGI